MNDIEIIIRMAKQIELDEPEMPDMPDMTEDEGEGEPE